VANGNVLMSQWHALGDGDQVSDGTRQAYMVDGQSVVPTTATINHGPPKITFISTPVEGSLTARTR